MKITKSSFNLNLNESEIGDCIKYDDWFITKMDKIKYARRIQDNLYLLENMADIIYWVINDLIENDT